MKLKLLIGCLFWTHCFAVPYLLAQQAKPSPWVKRDSLYRFFQPFGMLQLWTTFTMNEQADLNNNGNLVSVDNRVNTFLRRARVGFRGEAYKGLRYTVIFFYDQLGKDEFAGTRGEPNNGQPVGIFDAFGQWRIKRNSDLLHLTFGFFRPQVNRENFTPAWSVGSFEKTIDQNYTRLHIVGRNPGRSWGLNLGGMKWRDGFGVHYNVGMFSNQSAGADNITRNNTTGAQWSPVWTGRLAFNIGQPDVREYLQTYDLNAYNERKGITIAVSGTRQGQTDIFRLSQTVGVDILLNFNRLNFDAEWYWMRRHQNGNNYDSQSGHVRIGINTLIAKRYFIEPNVSIGYFRGADGASVVRSFDGEDVVIDAGINWYLDRRNLKLYLHYTNQSGFGTNNLYMRQNNRLVQKGDYWGLGVNMIFQ